MSEKTSPQNRLFHAQVEDIARQVRFLGRRWKAESWKRFMVESWVNVENSYATARREPLPFPEPAMLVPGVDGETIVQLGVQVRRLTREQMSNLIESTFAYGAMKGVVWSEKTKKSHQENEE